MTSKKLVVLAYYKYLKEQEISNLDLESNGSLERLKAHVTHSDLNRLHQLKIINKDIYDAVFKLL